MISIRRVLSIGFLLAGIVLLFNDYTKGQLSLIIAGLLDIADIIIWKTKGE